MITCLDSLKRPTMWIFFQVKVTNEFSIHVQASILFKLFTQEILYFFKQIVHESQKFPILEPSESAVVITSISTKVTPFQLTLYSLKIRCELSDWKMLNPKPCNFLEQQVNFKFLFSNAPRL